MNWDTVVPDWLDLIAEDTAVTAVLGDPLALSLSGERDRPPDPNSLEWTLISTREGELYETAVVQLDFWVSTLEELIALEKALRRLLHHDLPTVVGSLKIWSMLVGERPLAGPGSDGVLSRSLDFRLQYLRGRYT